MDTRPQIPRRGPPPSTLRSTAFAPPRRRWPGVLAATLIGIGIAAAAVTSFYHPQGDKPLHQAAGDAVTQAARNGATAAEHGVEALADAGITAAVKTALAADPALSALRIEVNTEDGVVRLEGPAPDARARDRAEVLAAAPQGVTRVDNRLVVTPPATTTN